MTGKKLGLAIFVSLFLLSSQAIPQSRTSEQNQDYPVNIFGLTSNDNTGNGDSDITLFSSAKSIAGLVVMMVVGGLASAGGGSGGALYICILLIFFQYTENQCVQIVYGLVFAGALGNIINVARNVETKTKRPLIDYDLALLLMPPMALGNGVGIILSKMAAPVVIIACLYLMLIYTLYKFILKLRSDLAKEKKAKKVKIQQIEQQVEVSIDSSTGLLNPFLKPQPKYVQFPLVKITVLILLLAFTILFALLRGTGNVPSIVNVSFCGDGFWGIFAGGLAVCLLFAVFTQNYLSSKNKLIQINHETSFSTINGYPRLDRGTMTKLSGLGLLAGVLGGLLGIGGVMVINPTLLSLGFATEIVAATSTFLILQTSLMALVQSFLEKDVPLAEQLIFMGISLVGGFMVSFVLKKLIEKYQKPTIILMILVGLVVVSMVATPVSEIFDYKGQYYEMLEFHDFCPSS